MWNQCYQARGISDVTQESMNLWDNNFEDTAYQLTSSCSTHGSHTSLSPAPSAQLLLFEDFILECFFYTASLNTDKQCQMWGRDAESFWPYHFSNWPSHLKPSFSFEISKRWPFHGSEHISYRALAKIMCVLQFGYKKTTFAFFSKFNTP